MVSRSPKPILRLRGPGELLGTRQSGLADFRLANLARDTQLLIEARKKPWHGWKRIRSSKAKSPPACDEILRHRWGKRLQLGAVGDK